MGAYDREQDVPPAFKGVALASLQSGSNVAGVGVDLIRISRVEQAFQRRSDRFLKRIFSPRERLILAEKGFPSPSLAARFAAKEAVAKALGCGIGLVRWQELEILQGKNGQPFVSLCGGAARLARQCGIDGVAVSLSHDGPWAIAFAVAYKRQEAGNKKQEGTKNKERI